MRTESEMRKDLHTGKRRYFFNGWLIVASIIPLLPIPYWSRFIGEGKEYPATMWLWLVGAEVLVFSVRAYQYFIQKR